MTLKVQEMNNLKNRFHLKLLNDKEIRDKEIKGIKIIEKVNMEKYLQGGELLLTSFTVYQNCTISQFSEHIQNLIHKNVSGFVVKNRKNMSHFNVKMDILKKMCDDNGVILFELPYQEHFWDLICYVLKKLYGQEIALIRYNKLISDNFKGYIFHKDATVQNIIDLLYTMIDNPITIYYENMNILATTKDKKSDFELLDNITQFESNIILHYNFKKQTTKHHDQYVIFITFLGKINLYIVIDEKNRKLTDFDFVAIENAMDTIRYSFSYEFVRYETNKKYHKDIFFNLINCQLNEQETIEAANLLNLDDNSYYRLISFHSIEENQKDKYTLEQLDEVEIIADEISLFYSKDHVYKNGSQIVMLQKMNTEKEDNQSTEQLDKLVEIIKKNIKERGKEINFNAGVGEIVKGYQNLQSSYKQSRIAMKCMSIAQRITRDENKSVVYYSRLGVFQIFLEGENVDKLKKYVPSVIFKLEDYDREHNSDLLNTLKLYINNNMSLKKTADHLSIQYRSASYRIQKIKDITNINFEDEIQLLSIRNGLIIYDMTKIF